MKIRRLEIRDFRGFRKLSIRPTGHVVLMGTPGSGRSDVIAALSRVLDPETIRRRIADEFDFHGEATNEPAEVEIAVGELGADLEQEFLDQLELWDDEQNEIVLEADEPAELGQEGFSFVLRLCYRAYWSDEEQRVDEFIYYPKTSQPGDDLFDHARYGDIARLEFSRIRVGAGRILDLTSRGSFRRLVHEADGDDFGAAVNEYVENVAKLSEGFTQSPQLKAAATELFGILSESVAFEEADPEEALRFVPEGGAGTGLLRSLTPSLDLDDGAGPLPVNRHGSSTSNLLRVAEALALASESGGIVAIDDLGDGIDPGESMHLAAVLERRSEQAWITTRLPSVAEVFSSDEVFRLSRDGDGERVVHQGRTDTSKSGRIAAKHWTRNILPVLSFAGTIVVEGPDDFISLHTLSLRLAKEKGLRLPASRGVSLLNAAAVGSGGATSVVRLARLARRLGVWSVALIDFDKADDTEEIFADAKKAADFVIRLPKGFAIERALLTDVDEDVLQTTLYELTQAAGLTGFDNVRELSGTDLEKAGITILKARGLHGPYLEWLPINDLPPVACEVLERAVTAAADREEGFVQL